MDKDENQAGFHKRNIKKIILEGLFVLFLLMLATIVYAVGTGKVGPLSQKSTKQSGQITKKDIKPGKNCVSNPNPVFNSTFIDVSKIKSIGPLGNINAGSPGRGYITAKGDTENTREIVPVFAATDMTLEGIVFARRDPTKKNIPGEYRLDFRVSCEVTLHYDHLDKVVEKIRTVSPVEPAENTREPKSVSIDFKEGDLLGYSNGTALAGTFDFFLLNSTKKVQHLNPERWHWEQTTIADCPYDYFKEDLKNQYYSLIQTLDGRKLEGTCGSISHDVAGTLSGGWFKPGATDQQGGWLEVGNVYGKVEVNIRGLEQFFMLRDYNSQVFPEDIKIGSSVCYTDSSKWAYLKLISENQIKAATGTGSCPAIFPESSSQIWER